MVVNIRNTKNEIYNELKKKERELAVMKGIPEKRGRGRPKKKPIEDPVTDSQLAAVTQKFVDSIIKTRKVITDAVGLEFPKQRAGAKITPETWEFMEYWWAMGASDQEVRQKLGMGQTPWDRYFQNHPEMMDRKNEVKNAPAMVADQNITLAIYKENAALKSGKIQKPEISMWKAERDASLKAKYQKTQHIVTDKFDYNATPESKMKLAKIFKVEVEEPTETELIEEPNDK